MNSPAFSAETENEFSYTSKAKNKAGKTIPLQA